jgi:hypothetical protein
VLSAITRGIKDRKLATEVKAILAEEKNIYCYVPGSQNKLPWLPLVNNNIIYPLTFFIEDIYQ